MKDDDKKPEEKDEQAAPNEEKKSPEDEKKPEEKPKEKPKETPEEKPEEASEEKKPEEPTEDEPAEKPTENTQEIDKLKAENLRLTTQLEAIKAGFSPDLTEEAVLLAENIAAKEGCDIKEALSKVAAKFPEWKKDPEERKKEKKGGIRVGAPAGEKPPENAPKQPAAVKRWNRVNSI